VSSTALQWLMVVSLGVAALGWLVYPIVLALLARNEDVDEQISATPAVSVIVATREAPVIVRERVANLLAGDYPPTQLHVLVAIDASVAGKYEEYARVLGDSVELIRGDLPGGKACALNAAVRAARNDILVFTDSAQTFAPDAIRRLVSALASGRYSAISGKLRTSADNSHSSALGAFWNYELWIRRHEAALHSVIGVTGAIYATRRCLWTPLPAGVLCDDVAVPMNLVLGGHRVGMCDSAVAFDLRQFTPREEYRRKVRTQTGILQLCALDPRLLNPLRNPVWFQFVCHKLIRLATPVLLLLAAPGFTIWLGRLATRTDKQTVIVCATAILVFIVALAIATRGRIFLQILAVLLVLAAPMSAIYFAVNRKWKVWAPSAAPVDSDKLARILYIEVNTDGTVGGSYFSLLYLVMGLDRRIYHPIVLFAAPNALIARFTHAGIDTRVMSRRLPLHSTNAVIRPIARVANFVGARFYIVRNIFRHFRFLKRERIKLVHLNNSITMGFDWMFAAHLAGVPCITHQRGSPRYYSAISRTLGKGLAAVICISDDVHKNLLAWGPRGLRLETVRNGLDPSAVSVTKPAAQIRADLGLAHSTRLIGMVGNIQAWKGQDVVIQAMTQLRVSNPDTVCLLIGAVSPNDAGDLSYYDDITRMIGDNGLGDTVIMTGYRPDVADYMNALEIVVHASTVPEPFGRVLLEAMALSKPVIACRSGGATEIVRDGETGLLYTPGNAAELAACLGTLLADPLRCERMGKAGYQRLIAEFGIAKNVALTQAIYQRAFAASQ
jgi:glycosyltransferase involved in cell wall biosynthesis/cellulose synthase/poly-beta-1,6-N-acetylglucosamine synthase-like glycosyltransferase